MTVITSKSAVRYLLAAGISVVCLAPFVRIMMPVTDEGTLIYGAVRVLNGQLPYRDFFEAMGPGTFYLLALFFKIFGTTWAATRIALMLTSSATALLMYLLARRLRTGMDAVPAILFFATAFGPLWPTISHHGDSNLFALLSFAVFLRALDRSRPWLLCAAGALAGLATCFLQPKGALLFASYLLVLGLTRKRRDNTVALMSWAAAGYVAIGIAVAAWFWLRGGLGGLLYVNLTWPLSRYGNVNSVHYALGLTEFYWDRWAGSFGAVFGRLGGLLVGSILIVPFLFVAALPLLLGMLAIRYRRAAFDPVSLPYWICGVAIWISEIHRKDIMHLVYGSPLLVILFFYLWQKLRPRFYLQTMQIFAVCTVLLGLFNAGVVLSARTTLATRRGPVTTFQPDPALEFLIAHVRPGEDVFVYPFRPMYYFLGDVNNPTRYSIMMYGYNIKDQFGEAIRSVESHQVEYVLWDDVFEEDKGASWTLPEGWKLRSYDLIVEPYLESRYREVIRFQDIRVLKRNAPVK